jgi:hypothetical protein
MNKCSCGQPATWLLLVFDHDDQENRAHDHWATCDEHVAQSTRSLIRRVVDGDGVLRLAGDRFNVVIREDRGPN